MHVAVGGRSGDMGNTQASSNDPVFYLHHNNVERWWRIWQQEHPDQAFDYEGDRVPGSELNDASPDDIMPFYGLFPDTPVGEALNLEGGLNGALVSISYRRNLLGPT